MHVRIRNFFLFFFENHVLLIGIYYMERESTNIHKFSTSNPRQNINVPNNYVLKLLVQNNRKQNRSIKNQIETNLRKCQKLKRRHMK